jgi:hypothetical protein
MRIGRISPYTRPHGKNAEWGRFPLSSQWKTCCDEAHVSCQNVTYLYVSCMSTESCIYCSSIRPGPSSMWYIEELNEIMQKIWTLPCYSGLQIWLSRSNWWAHLELCSKDLCPPWIGKGILLVAMDILPWHPYLESGVMIIQRLSYSNSF